MAQIGNIGGQQKRAIEATKRANTLKSADLDQILAINAVFWDQAADLLKEGYQPNTYLREGAKGYHVTFSKKGATKTLVAIDKKSTIAVPAIIDGISLFQIMATYSKATSITLPLVPFGENQDKPKSSVIRMSRPNPKIQWTLEIDGASLTGEKNKPRRIEPFGAVIETARFAGATTAELMISDATREYFQTRLRRNQWVNEELALKDLNLRTWCLDKGHNYQTVYRVLHRGDDLPDIKAMLARIAKKKVQEMWPKIEWD